MTCFTFYDFILWVILTLIIIGVIFLSFRLSALENFIEKCMELLEKTLEGEDK